MKRMERLFAIVTALFSASAVQAEPTAVTVHVISQDAKFIGDSMGGAKIVLRDAKSGRVLAKGITKGGTGDTARIMQSTGRSPSRATPDAAAFKAILEIERPTLVNLEVTGPNARPGSVIRITSQRWIMPGEPANVGDGWVVELPGLAISPSVKFADFSQVNVPKIIAVSAKVELLCGCPITPGGLWEAKDYRVTVSIWQRGRRISHSSMTFVEAPGKFAGQFAAPNKGKYQIFIFAENVRTGNSGVTEVQQPAS
jgi:hypothetical protein